MKILGRLVFILICFSFSVCTQNRACATSVTINFEGLSDGTVVGATYSAYGAIFNGAVVVTAGQSLNELEFPPHSGLNAVFDASGPITVDFTNPVDSFSAFFTYTTALSLNAFGPSLLVSATSSFSQNFVSSGNPPNEQISLIAPGITSVTITGDPAGGSFVMDDVSFTTVTPEPPTVFYMLTALAAIIIFKVRR